MPTHDERMPTGVLLLTIPEAARLLRISVSSMYERVLRDPLFPALSIGGRRLVSAAALERWIDQHLPEGARARSDDDANARP